MLLVMVNKGTTGIVQRPYNSAYGVTNKRASTYSFGAHSAISDIGSSVQPVRRASRRILFFMFHI